MLLGLGEGGTVRDRFLNTAHTLQLSPFGVLGLLLETAPKLASLPGELLPRLGMFGPLLIEM